MGLHKVRCPRPGAVLLEPISDSGGSGLGGDEPVLASPIVSWEPRHRSRSLRLVVDMKVIRSRLIELRHSRRIAERRADPSERAAEDEEAARVLQALEQGTFTPAGRGGALLAQVASPAVAAPGHGRRGQRVGRRVGAGRGAGNVSGVLSFAADVPTAGVTRPQPVRVDGGTDGGDGVAGNSQPPGVALQVPPLAGAADVRDAAGAAGGGSWMVWPHRSLNRHSTPGCPAAPTTHGGPDVARCAASQYQGLPTTSPSNPARPAILPQPGTHRLVRGRALP